MKYDFRGIYLILECAEIVEILLNISYLKMNESCFASFKPFFSGFWINKLYVILLQAQWYIIKTRMTTSISSEALNLLIDTRKKNNLLSMLKRNE